MSNKKAKIDPTTVDGLVAAAHLCGITVRRWNRKRVTVEVPNHANRFTVRKRVIFAVMRHVLHHENRDPIENTPSTLRVALERNGVNISEPSTKALVRGFQAWLRTCS